MKYSKFIIIAFLATIILAACSSAKVPVKNSLGQSTSTGCTTPNANALGSCQASTPSDSTPVPTEGAEQPSTSTKSDGQGAVTVDITPLNLDQPGDTLLFDVTLNTHSIDLSMDLAQLSTLTTDTGKTIQASLWDAPKGGHHVEGKLSFPATLDGKNILDGANEFTITITNLDAASRIFSWQLTK